MKRKHYFSFDKDQVDAVDKVFEALRLGDAPDQTLGLIQLLLMDGWELTRQKR